MMRFLTRYTCENGICPQVAPTRTFWVEQPWPLSRPSLSYFSSHTEMPSNPGAEVLASGLGAAITDTIFNPLEMLKVRVQTSDTTFQAAARAVYAKGGPWLLWTPGLQATWVRSFCVTGLRVGLYGPVKRAASGDGPTTSFATKFAVGGATGALSSALANPIDMVRTRVHAQVGLSTRYATTAAAALHVVRCEGGVTALWRGLGASAVRQVCLSGGQLASYDSAKQAARGTGVSESPPLHVACAALSGVVGQLCCMPADVIKVLHPSPHTPVAVAMHACGRSNEACIVGEGPQRPCMLHCYGHGRSMHGRSMHGRSMAEAVKSCNRR